MRILKAYIFKRNGIYYFNKTKLKRIDPHVKLESSNFLALENRRKPIRYPRSYQFIQFIFLSSLFELYN